MVSITKFIILGLGIITAAFFFKEASGSSLTSTLARTGAAGSTVGSGIGDIGAGVGEFGVRALDPFFSLADLFKKFGNLFGGGNGAEVTTSTTDPNISTTGGVSFSETNPQTPTNWFDPFPAAAAQSEIISPSHISSVGGSNILSSVISWVNGTTATLPLSEEARDYYGDLGVTVTTGGGGGSGTTGGSGGGSGGSGTSAAGNGGGNGGSGNGGSGNGGGDGGDGGGGGSGRPNPRFG